LLSSSSKAIRVDTNSFYNSIQFCFRTRSYAVISGWYQSFMSMIDPHTLTDEVLIETVARLAAKCRETTADLIAHLIVLEERNLHLACGFNSLFGYCHRVLGCSESASYDRMQAAHAARRFPVVLTMLADGSLHLTAVRLLAPHLNDEDHLALLGGAIRKSGRQVRALLARWFPQPDVPALVRRLPGGRCRPTTAPSAAATAQPAVTAAATASPAIVGPATSAPATSGPATSAPDASPVCTTTEGSVGSRRPASVPAPAKRAVEPLAPGRNLFRFTGDDETAALLWEAQELLSHTLPDGDVAAIVKRALVLLVAEARRARFAATTKPIFHRPTAADAQDAGTPSRTIAASVQRFVWERDGGQCAYIGDNGWRCEERRFLEYHHLTPWIVGGPPSAVNIALRCRAHNQYEAKVYFAPIRAAWSDDPMSDA
jgi:hypothetical protein